MNPRLRAIVCFAERSAYRAGGQSSALPQEWTRIAKKPASPARSPNCSLASLVLTFAALGRRVRPLAGSLGSTLVLPWDVEDIASVDAVFDEIGRS